ncbi:MAG: hypothetical protein C4527_22005 [Candidatus Omnitrophota bacterium]|jgi:nitrate/nitrite transporter NarK|nr:MAG: hypothetical protein C4527_22005 [Candidatus Omnitrophota bacterium]
MKILFRILSLVALIGTVLPSMLYCGGNMELDTVKWLMLCFTIVWFIITPLWMNQKPASADESQEEKMK